MNKFLYENVFISLGHTPRNGTAGSEGESMINFLRNQQTVFRNGFTTFAFPLTKYEGSSFSTSWSILLFSKKKKKAIRMGVKWYLTVVLIGISRTTNCVEHLFKRLPASCTSSLEKCLLKSFACVQLGYLYFSCWIHTVLESSLWCYLWDLGQVI